MKLKNMKVPILLEIYNQTKTFFKGYFPIKFVIKKKGNFRCINRNLFFLIFIALQVNQFMFYEVEAVNFRTLKSLSYRCFFSKDIKSCGFAVSKAEELQALAGAKENYSCQTRLLGFQSKLIMAMFNLPRARTYMENLNDVKRACSNYF